MKKIIATVIIILSLGAFSFIYLENQSNNTPTIKEEPVEEPIIDKIQEQLDSLTLEEKIGQMLFVFDRIDTMNDEMENMLTTVKPGGFIFFKENFTTYEKTMALIEKINKTASIPLFLGTDEEGGTVDRFSNIKGFSYNKIPSMAEIGAEENEETAYETGNYIASLLNAFGLNLNFAPVSDVGGPESVMKTRSFGSDPYLVARMATAIAKGMSDSDIIPVFKHFPGHGSTTTDSHQSLPIINKTKDELLKSDLIPFKNAIENQAEIIMVGHIALPNVTKDNTPASLSKTIITDILKNELGYQNLVITDALNMKALTDNYSEEEIYEMAINAGADILLMPNDPNQAVQIIKQLIEENKVTKEQINDSVYKILKLKNKYLIEKNNEN